MHGPMPRRTDISSHLIASVVLAGRNDDSVMPAGDCINVFLRSRRYPQTNSSSDRRPCSANAPEQRI